jgi:hypothetical protein
MASRNPNESTAAK